MKTITKELLGHRVTFDSEDQIQFFTKIIMYNNGQRRRMIEQFNITEGLGQSWPKFTQKLSLSGLWNLN